MTGRALILDCDGVLADTELDGHLVAFNRTFEELGMPFRWSAEEYGPLLRIGGGKERLRAYLAQHPEIDLGTSEEVDDLVVRAHKRKSEIYVELVEGGALPGRPGIARIVTEALDAGWQVACASTSAEKSVEAVLASVVGPETRRRMAGVFAGDVVPAKKPAPDIYLLAAESLGRTADEIVVIEDSQSGAAAAAAAGMAHVVTVSHFTAEDEFPAAAVIVDVVGDARTPATVRSGLDVRDGRGVIGVDGLEKILAARS
ncbi:HAD-IA family hydrolase [Microbacterium sp. IEGM 1404]|uniref:HAD-IA family hydrolase n=1 Tax=Microbacterium sp. IEGM 1404 TaxID=3047084 RepID=UPI0024B7E34D|nr:HAD-IA family hydrolase [Microbacterium sp. IEGM 1404]MDI9891109.1 HAD-IA family hydrolase [Microbacterium sp. IEGM 1404]